MAKGKRGQFYDEDDLDDGYDDEYDDDEDGGYEGRPAQPPPPRQAAPSPAKPAAAPRPSPGPAPGPARSAAKPDPAARALQQPAYPLAPHVGAGAQGGGGGGGGTASSPARAAPAAFSFDTPSPDDAIRAAQERRSGAVPPPSASSAPVAPTIAANKNFLRPSNLLAQQRQSPPAAASPAPSTPASTAAAAAAARGVAGLTLGAEAAADGGSSVGSGSVGVGGGGGTHHHHHPGSHPAPDGAPAAHAGGMHGLHTRRAAGGYAMEPELAREVEAAAAADAAAAAAALPASPSAPGARPPLHLVVLGHVDAGKSSLMGRLLAELGLVSAKEVHRHQRDAAAAGKGSFAWAWVLDERPEERQRGVTVDVAMTRFNTRRFCVTLLDAPGHRDFVPNMIAGAAQADAALLLVDGSPGGFEAGFSEGSGGMHGPPGGQTREHAALARSLGVEQLAVVVSKLDTVAYDKARFDSIRATLAPFLRSVGFREAATQWLPGSGPLGENLVGPPQDPALAAWWRGPSVLDAIDAFAPRERPTGRPLRMPVTDVFKSRSGAVVLGGKLEAGALRPGSRVALVPGPGGCFTVRSLEVGGAPAQLARAGDSCEVALAPAQGGHGGGGAGGGGGGGALEPGSVAAGAVLCHPDFPAVTVTRFELRALVLDAPVPLLRGASVTLHAHAAREEGTVTELTALLDPRTGEVAKARPRCATRGQTVLLEVTARRPLVLEEAAECRALGRVALREGGRTLAVGVVTRLLA